MEGHHSPTRSTKVNAPSFQILSRETLSSSFWVLSDVMDDEVRAIELMKNSKARCVDGNSSVAMPDAAMGMISIEGWVKVGEESIVIEPEDLELPKDWECPIGGPEGVGIL